MNSPSDKASPASATFVVAPIGQFEPLVTEFVAASPSAAARKLHSSYFQEYFSRIKARTIVVEKPYVDRDFLEDFSAYYVRCFENYPRKCARFHFFTDTFTTEQLAAVLRGESGPITQDTLKAAYLGFMVVKPLPQTFIGRTCLTTRGSPSTSDFPAGHTFNANLFGIDLKVENTLPFQEQDSVVAACATSALWSAFHATGRVFHHSIPSPVEITKAATQHLPAESRSLPNRGLHPHMMAQAIREIGLEPYYVGAQNFFVLLGTAYAYLRARIPPVLGAKLLDKRHPVDDPAGKMGKHAVAITGYNLGLSAPRPMGKTGFLLKASRIDKLYVHDDQIGPFARMEMVNYSATVTTNAGPVQVPAIGTLWLASSDRSQGNVIALPEILMIPLYHKIRIPYETVQTLVVEFDEICVALGAKYPDVGLKDRFEWDIYLTTINDLKSEVLRNQKLTGERLLQLLSQPMPKYLWRATAHNSQGAAFDLLFDATDIENGSFVVRIVGYNEVLVAFLAEVASGSSNEIDKAFSGFDRGKRILKAFSSHTVAAS